MGSGLFFFGNPVGSETPTDPGYVFFFCNPVGREDVDGFGFLLIPFGILSASESAGRLRISSFSR